MKIKEIEVGKTYKAKVSNRLVNVRVLRQIELTKSRRNSFSGMWEDFTKIVFEIRNISTGRVLKMSAAKLRYMVEV